MTVQTSHHARSSTIQSPVNDQLYDLLQVIVSKCEAIEAYARYEEDASGDVRQLFHQMAQHDAQDVERLLEALRQELGR